MTPDTTTRIFCILAFALFTNGISPARAAVEPPGDGWEPQLLTNLAELQWSANQLNPVIHPFRIVAEVLMEDCANNVLVLQDPTGIEFVRFDLQGQTLEPGMTVCLEGNGCGFQMEKFGLVLQPKLIVDNDGIHGYNPASGSLFLKTGRTPFSLQWFNRLGDFSLNLEYEGPSLPRQRIQDSSLLRSSGTPAGTGANLSAGVDFQCFEGAWDRLPDFNQLHPVRTGIAPNFDLNVRTRNDRVGLIFKGFLKVPRAGVYTFHLASDDGSRLFLGEATAQVRILGRQPAPVALNIPPSAARQHSRHALVTVAGTVTQVSYWVSGGEFNLRVGNDNIRVEVFANGTNLPALSTPSQVRVTGIYEDITTGDNTANSGLLRVPSWKAVQTIQSSDRPPADDSPGRRSTTNEPAAMNGQTIITTAAEVKTLSPETARQRLPVSIRGVITSFRSAYSGAVIQDSSRGVFVDVSKVPELQPLQRGEYCQIDGVTDPGFFAPQIEAQHIIHLGAGRLPVPVQATWNQLVNGSLDTQYAEVQGVVTAVQDNFVTLLTDGGKITLEFADFRPDALHDFENALVQIRGCLFPHFDLATHKLDAGSLLVSGASVTIVQPALRDRFDAPQRSVGELLFYDPKAAPLRCLKVRGQIIYSAANDYFLSDGTNGIRVATVNSNAFAAGDVVDAVGFLSLGKPVAELKEALMRKTGRAALPAPAKLQPDHLLEATHAGTWVQTEATLLDRWRDGADLVLSLQSGFVAFQARLNCRTESVSWPQAGSKLELTGVYVPLGNGPGNGNVNGFELLLSPATGIHVLALPPWWTLKRVFALAAILAVLLGVVLLWNKQLQRKVQERGRQLETEIRNRQRAELKQAEETERARIARDLHDELGTGLTEVSLLASAGLADTWGPEKNRNRFHNIAEKARALVAGLDVIVWAINPKLNSLQSFADYLGCYATELFSSTNIVCRFKIPIECAAVSLTESARHNLFLAVKEALNNVIRHASATEVELQILQAENRLKIVITDNGRGFDRNTVRRGNGLANLRDRAEMANSECHIESKIGQGTTVTFIVPLPGDPPDSGITTP